MTEVERILDQYDRAMNGNAWHGDNVWCILGSVEPQQAFERRLGDRHTIWELVAHMTFWETEVRRRLEGVVRKPDERLNFPPAPEANRENWENLLQQFRVSNGSFRNAVGALNDIQLEQPLSAPDKSVYVEVHGVIQHNLYHAGQIALLHKNLASGKVQAGL
jgi:hypothetical protein